MKISPQTPTQVQSQPNQPDASNTPMSYTNAKVRYSLGTVANDDYVRNSKDENKTQRGLDPHIKDDSKTETNSQKYSQMKSEIGKSTKDKLGKKMLTKTHKSGQNEHVDLFSSKCSKELFEKHSISEVHTTN